MHRIARFLVGFVLWAALFDSIHAIEAQQPCTLCSSGNDDSVDLTKEFHLDGLPVDSCQALLGTMPFLQQGDAFCPSIQAIGTVCGCPIPPNACTLCHDGSRVTDPLALLDGYEATDYGLVVPPGTLMNCEFLEAYLHSKGEEDSICLTTQVDVGEKCGCSPHPTGNTTGIEETIDSTTNVLTPADDNKQTPTPCNLCRNGGSMTLPDKAVDLESLPVKNCNELNMFAPLLPGDSTECLGMQSLGVYCGCPMAPGACTLCANGEPVPQPHRPVEWIMNVQGAAAVAESAASMTCDLLASALADPPPPGVGIDLDPDVMCMHAQLRSTPCGCRPDPRAVGIVWCFRISGILSLIGSLLIVRDILRRRPDKRTMYHQIVFGISAFDIISSLAYALGGLLDDKGSGFYGNRGNQATCRFQGFMLQAGLTSVMYNVVLSVYFLLIVRYNWQESRFHRYRRYLHPTLIIIGVSAALAAIPFYTSKFGTCYVVHPPVNNSWVPLSVFYTVPIIMAFLTMTISTLQICHHVYKQEKTSRKWSATKNMALTKRVVTQSLWYSLSFMVTIPFPLAAYFVHHRTARVFITSGVLSPAQGLLSALVYFQRKDALAKLCSGKCWPVAWRSAPARDPLPKKSGESSRLERVTGPSTEIMSSQVSREFPDSADGFNESDTVDDNCNGDGDNQFSAAAIHWQTVEQFGEEPASEPTQRSRVSS